MKSKVVALLLIAAIATVSFTINSTRNEKTKVENKSEVSGPIGGFVLEDKF